MSLFNGRNMVEIDDCTVSSMYGTPCISREAFGIELELEGCGIDFGEHDELSHWRVVEDNSLRNNGREFVSKILSRKQLPAALKQLQSVFDEFPDTHPSFRCGTHLHINFSDHLTADVVKTVMSLLLFENALVSVFAPERRQSVFCVSWADTRGLFSTTKAWSSTLARYCLSNLIDTSGKYRTINLVPLTRYGTIEFRMFPSTTDVDQISTYVDTVYRIIDLHKKVGFDGVWESLRDKPEDTLAYVFGDVRKPQVSMVDLLEVVKQDMLHVGSAVL